MRYAQSIVLLLLAGPIFLISCGEPVVSVDEEPYQPKIVVDAYIFPDKPVEQIKIRRNYPLGVDIDESMLQLPDAAVTITDLAAERSHQLIYQGPSTGYAYYEDDLKIECGKSYRLDVEATVDGRLLRASATTTVPGPGFEIDPLASGPDSLIYLQEDANGDLEHFEIVFQRAVGTGFYVFSITALDYSADTFIHENLFDVQLEDLEEGQLEDLANDEIYRQHLLSEPGISSVELFWSNFYFYGDYRIIGYAGDRNFEEFFLTFDSIQSDDGNLYEPRFNIEGDGIGVFGSAMVDTAYIEVMPTGG